MPAVIVSLGSIVETNGTTAIFAFQALTDELRLGLQVPQLMPKLQPFFIAFNLGKLSTEDFKLKVTELFFEHAQKKDDVSKKAFLDRFEACWNAMCIVDDQAKDVMRYIEQQSLSGAVTTIMISDTNPLHVEHIESEMGHHGLKVAIEATFRRGCPKQALLLRIVEQLRGINPQETITLVLGKNDQITDLTLLAMTEQRDVKVMDVASYAQVMIKRLEGARISVSDLALLMPREERRRSSSTSLPIIPAFNAMAGRQQDSPRPGIQGAVSTVTNEALPDRAQLLSPK